MLRRTSLFALLLASIALLGAARGDGEGPLRNESRVPMDDVAARAFADADRALRAARASGDGAQAPIFEAWLAAFAAADPARVLPVAAQPAASRPETLDADLAGSRIFEGRECALLRRVRWLAPFELESWRAHTEPIAAAKLAAAGADETLLGELEGALPGTRGRALAALRLADLAAASGDPVAASGWLLRAREQLDVYGTDDLAQAVARRTAALAQFTPTRATSDFADATGLEPLAQIALDDPLGPNARVAGLPPGAGLFPGLVALDDGRFAVQTASRIHLVDPVVGRLVGRFEPTLLFEQSIGGPPPPLPANDQPGWHLRPGTDGRALLLVEGRSAGRSNTSNALVRVEPPHVRREQPLPDGALLCELGWALSAGGLVGKSGSVVPAPELAGLEFQPGPVVLGRTALVQTRRGIGGEFEAALFAVNWRDGSRRFERAIVVGREVGPDLGRFTGIPARGAASPIEVRGTRVLLATNLGVVALVDALDGRLIFSLRTQRRDAATSREGWTGVRAALGTDRAWLAPADSDLLYTLPLAMWPVQACDPAALREPLARGEALFLCGAVPSALAPEPAALLVAVRSGPRQALALLDPLLAETTPGVFLPLGEALCEGAWVSPRGRCVVAAGERHVYLFDLERELFLLDQRALTDPLAPRDRGRNPALGGSVHVLGSRAAVLSSDALVLFAPAR